MPKKILITGADGQLGKKIKDLSPEYSDFNFIYTDQHELDITNTSDTRSYIKNNKPDIIINCAAYTQVDKAESEPDSAKAVNTRGPENLVKACSEINAEFIHVSTDYVFGNAKQNRPFKPDDPVSPASVYGQTKVEGEKALKDFKKVRIIRTAWLYSEYGNNFLKTMLRLGKERRELNVVYDQISSPTYAGDLASALLQLAQTESSPESPCEILHYTNEGVCSWYDFAYEIFRQSEINCRLNPIATDKFPTPAKRPPYSVLDKTAVKEKYKISIPDYRESLAVCLKKLIELGT